MRTILLLTSMLLAVPAAYGAPDTKAKVLTGDDICRRLTITEEVYVTSADGQQILYKGPQYKMMRRGVGMPNKDEAKGVACRMNGGGTNQSTAFSQPIHFNHEWTVFEDGKIKATLRQFSERNEENKPATPVKTETYTVKDLASIIWVSPLHTKERVIERLVPNLSDDEEAADLAKLPIAGDGMVVTDSKGVVWAKNASISGVYIGLTTTQGRLLVSYYPFPGSKKLGTAHRDEMELNLGDGLLLWVTSKDNFLPGDKVANVYGLFDPTKRTKGPHSTQVHTTDDEDRFVEKNGL